VETGARNIDHIMQGTLLPGVSSEILQKMAEGALPERLEITIDDSGEFQIQFLEKQALPASSRAVAVQAD